MILIFDLRSLLHEKISGVEIFTKNIAKSVYKNLPKDWKLVFWTNASKKFDFKEFELIGECIQTFIPNKIFNISASIFRYPKIDKLVLSKLQDSKEKCILFIPDPRPSPVSSNCKKIFTIHDLSPFHFSETFNLKTRFFHKLIRFKKELDESNKVITPSQYTKDDVIKIFDISSSKIQVIHEGIEEELINNKEIKPKEKFPENFFLSLSTFEPRKNLEKLLQAFLKAQKQIPDLNLILVGRKNEEIFNKLDLQKSGIKNITFIERFISVEEKKWLYKNATGFLYVSLFEGFGLPLIEAMSQGCPVIYGDNSSMPEVVGDSGIAVDSKNIDEISGAIIRLEEDKELQEALSMKGIKRAKNFSWDKAGKELIEVIKNI